MSESEIDKARKQLSIWVTTNDLVDRLARLMRLSKAEIVHMAVAEMAEKYLRKEDDE